MSAGPSAVGGESCDADGHTLQSELITIHSYWQGPIAAKARTLDGEDLEIATEKRQSGVPLSCQGRLYCMTARDDVLACRQSDASDILIISIHQRGQLTESRSPGHGTMRTQQSVKRSCSQVSHLAVMSRWSDVPLGQPPSTLHSPTDQGIRDEAERHDSK